MTKAKAKRNPTSRANDSKTQSRNSVRRTSARKAAPLKSVTVLRGGGHGQAIERDDLAPRQPVGEATAHRSDISTGIAASTLPRVIAESGALHANRLRLLQCV